MRMRAAGLTERLERELLQLGGRVEGHNQSLAREFDRALDVLGDAPTSTSRTGS